MLRDLKIYYQLQFIFENILLFYFCELVQIGRYFLNVSLMNLFWTKGFQSIIGKSDSSFTNLQQTNCSSGLLSPIHWMHFKFTERLTRMKKSSRFDSSLFFWLWSSFSKNVDFPHDGVFLQFGPNYNNGFWIRKWIWYPKYSVECGTYGNSIPTTKTRMNQYIESVRISSSYVWINVDCCLYFVTLLFMDVFANFSYFFPITSFISYIVSLFCFSKTWIHSWFHTIHKLFVDRNYKILSFNIILIKFNLLINIRGHIKI